MDPEAVQVYPTPSLFPPEFVEVQKEYRAQYAKIQQIYNTSQCFRIVSYIVQFRKEIIDDQYALECLSAEAQEIWNIM